MPYPSAAAIPHNIVSQSSAGGGQVHLLGWRHNLSLPLDLRQCRLRLGQPEGHLHGAIQVDSSGQRNTGRLSLADLGIQCAEAPVAVRHERAHAEFLSQGQGLAVIDDSLVDVRGLAMRSDLTEQPEGIRLVSTLLVIPGEVEGTLSKFEQQFPLMNCESYVTVAADSSRSVSPTRFRLLQRLSQSAMAGCLVAGRLISCCRHSFPTMIGDRLVRWNAVAPGIDGEMKKNPTQSWGESASSRTTGLRAVAAWT
jgi:hypothetical protein